MCLLRKLQRASDILICPGNVSCCKKCSRNDPDKSREGFGQKMFSQNTMLLVQKQLTSFFAVRQRFSGQFPREFLLLCCGFCPTTRETIDLELVNVLVYVPHQFLLELNYGNQLLAFVSGSRNSSSIPNKFKSVGMQCRSPR